MSKPKNPRGWVVTQVRKRTDNESEVRSGNQTFLIKVMRSRFEEKSKSEEASGKFREMA
jgi:hypothetical protein